MDISSLNLFLVVATKLNFVAAANELGVDPSSVSRKITFLEKELGACLFNRNTRSVTMTSFGVQFVEHAERIIREYNLALENAQDESNNVSGSLRVTTSVAFAERILVSLLPKFLKLYPEISVHLLPSDRNLDLAKESIDVAIRLTQQVSGDYIITKLFQTKYSIYASPSCAEKFGEINSLEHLSGFNPIAYELPGLRSHWRFRKKTDKTKEFLIDVKGRIAVSSPSVIREMALMGYGPAMLANWMVKEDLDSGRLVEVLPEYEVTPTNFDTGAWLLYVNSPHVPKKIKAFINFLKNEVGCYYSPVGAHVDQSNI